MEYHWLNSSVIPAVGFEGYGDEDRLGDVCGALVAVVGFHFCLMALTRKPAGFLTCPWRLCSRRASRAFNTTSEVLDLISRSMVRLTSMP